MSSEYQSVEWKRHLVTKNSKLLVVNFFKVPSSTFKFALLSDLNLIVLEIIPHVRYLIKRCHLPLIWSLIQTHTTHNVSNYKGIILLFFSHICHKFPWQHKRCLGGRCGVTKRVQKTNLHPNLQEFEGLHAVNYRSMDQKYPKTNQTRYRIISLN